jgi:hypothetical protein
MAAAFWIAPTHADELLAIEALRLQPRPPARLRHPLRDDAFGAVLSGQSVGRRTAPGLVVGELEARGCIGQ